MKKLVSLVIVMALVLSLAVGAAAAETGSITITNAIAGETYKIYKVFDLTYKGSNVSYTFTKTESNTALYDALCATDSPFTFTESTTAGKFNVTVAAGTSGETIATFLKTVESKLTLVDTLTGSASTKKEGLDYGYYFVTSSVGSVVTINSTTPDASITDKNTVPSIEKKQSADGATYATDNLDANIGDTIYYQIEITDGVGTDKEIAITDTMSNGITFNTSSITVKYDNSDVDSANYKVTNSTSTGFTLTLTADYVKTLDNTKPVVVTYTGTVNANAAINSDNNTNSATMSYSAQTLNKTVKLSTYDVVLKKSDGANPLAGAKFKLYDAATDGNEINLAKDSTGYYVSTSANEEIDAGDGSGVNIRGLKPGTYYFEETVTPDGYNPLTERKSITITTGQTASAELTVINNAGTTLPSTGGVGTTIFYVLGGLMFVGALVLLVTNKRMKAE